MKIINNIKTYINDDEFKINILKNRINIVNYETIGHFDNKKIIVYCKELYLIIHGEELVISKLMDEEILITGIIKNIELINDEK